MKIKMYNIWETSIYEKTGAGVTKCVAWKELGDAFSSRIRTGIVTYLTYTDLQFSNDTFYLLKCS